MSSFQESWLQEQSFLSWLAKANDLYSARCNVCVKTFSVTSMGVQALEAHVRGEKHRQWPPCSDSRRAVVMQFANQNEIQSESTSDPQLKSNRTY